VVFNATFNNISVISVALDLLVEENEENDRHATRHWQTLSLNVVEGIIHLFKLSVDKYSTHVIVFLNAVLQPLKYFSYV
jgi:hypothetical protein